MIQFLPRSTTTTCRTCLYACIDIQFCSLHSIAIYCSPFAICASIEYSWYTYTPECSVNVELPSPMLTAGAPSILWVYQARCIPIEGWTATRSRYIHWNGCCATESCKYVHWVTKPVSCIYLLEIFADIYPAGIGMLTVCTTTTYSTSYTQHANPYSIDVIQLVFVSWCAGFLVFDLFPVVACCIFWCLEPGWKTLCCYPCLGLLSMPEYQMVVVLDWPAIYINELSSLQYLAVS